MATILALLWAYWIWHFLTDDTIPYMYGGDGKKRLRDLEKDTVRCYRCGHWFVYTSGAGLCWKCKGEGH